MLLIFLLSFIIPFSILIPLLMWMLNREIESLAVLDAAIEPNGRDRSWAWSIGAECLVESGARVWRKTICGPIAEVHVCIFSEEAADSRANVHRAAIAW